MSIILWIVIVLAVLTAHYFIAGEFYKVAAMKGWSQKKYYYWALGAWLAGYLLIVALPDRTGDSMAAVVSDDLPEM